MLGFLMTESHVSTGTDQLNCQLLLHEITRSRKLTLSKKTCLCCATPNFLLVKFPVPVYLALRKKNKKRIIIWQKCTVVPAVRSVGVDRCVLSPLLLFQQQLCQMLLYFLATLYGYFPVLSCTAHHRVRKVTLFFWVGFCGEFYCTFKTVPVPNCIFFL